MLINRMCSSIALSASLRAQFHRLFISSHTFSSSSTLHSEQKSKSSKGNNEKKNQHEDPDLKVLHKEMTLKLPSRRLDAILKRTSGIGTTSLEKALSSSGVRVNDEVQKKKAFNVSAGDQIDMFLSPVADNPELARVHHVEVIEYQLDETNYQILVTVDRSYIVKSWKGGH